MRAGHVKKQDSTELLSRQHGVPTINLSQCEIEQWVTALIPPEVARKYQVIPLSCSGATLTVAMTDPSNVFAMDDVAFMIGHHLESVVASEADVNQALEKYYPEHGQPHLGGRGILDVAIREHTEISTFHEDVVEILEEGEELDVGTLEQQGGEVPVVRLVNVLLASAIRRGASDVHIEPYEKEFRVRFRVDGLLCNVMVPPLKMRDAVTSRIKIMAKLDIAEKRLPQDGRIKIRFRDTGTTKEIDIRVSCLPTLFGEKVVLRLLDRSRLMLDLGKLGFEPESLDRFEMAIRRPWGMVLVTGPTGSGKTNTLYSSISQLNFPHTNIMTAEDPVEFNLHGVNQVQIRERIGLTFATALRSFLRQDPDIVLVGEIRDFETSEVAIKAAQTGHLVLSTLHTNDAPSSITRLVNMGVEPFLVSSSVHLICAQRLVRRVCRHCAEPVRISSHALVELGVAPETVNGFSPVRGRGCVQCGDTGYRGRIGLFEVMEITDAVRDLILGRSSTVGLRRQAVREGMVSLRQSGLRKIAAGQTTVEEVTRETTP